MKKAFGSWNLLSLMIMNLIFICGLDVSPSFALFGDKVKHFSADSVTIDSSGKVLHTSRLYVSGDTMRIDDLGGMMSQEMGGQVPDLSMLAFQNQGKMYFYNHDKKLVYEGPLEEDDMMAGYKAMDNVESEKVLGKEKVSGYKCVKKKIVTSMRFMGMTRKERMIVWESDRFEFPLRTRTDDGDIHEIRNIKEGKPPKKLMKPLTGYKPVGNMMAVMGMDLGQMMAKAQAKDKEARTMPNPTERADAAGKPVDPQDLKNLDLNAMMTQMSQAMGENMTPEQKEEIKQAMNQAMGYAKQVKEGPNAAKQIWQYIPQRPSDQIGSEMKVPQALMVTMGSKAPLQSVFNFYKNKLGGSGWKDQGMYLQNGEGSLHMSKGDQSLTISSADDPGMNGNFKTFYMLQFQGPGI